MSSRTSQIPIHHCSLLAAAFLMYGFGSVSLSAATAGDGIITFTSGLDILGGTLGQLFGSEERGGIYVMRPDGSGLRQLTSFQTLNFRWQPDIFDLPDDHPTVSPDGKQILFTSSRADESGLLGGINPNDPDNFEVYIMKVNGTNLRRLTHFPGFDGEAIFSPDGARIAFSSQSAGGTFRTNPNIFIMDINGNVLQRVTDSPFSEIEPNWSPDGTKIVYARVTDEGTVLLGDEQKQIRITDADGLNKNNHALFDAPNQDHDPFFNPSGADIVITSELASTFPYGDVVRINPFTGQFLGNLTIDDTFLGVGGGGDPCYSPDGTKIAYIKAELGILRGPQKIHIMNANGSGKVKLDKGIPGLLNIHQNWGPVIDSDGDGKPDYLENGNTSFTREAVTGFGLFGQQVLTRSQPGEQFGAAIALADLNHDGHLDLIIGSPGLDEGGLIANSGGVAIVPGSTLGPQFSPTLLDSFSTVLSRLASERPLPVTDGHFGQTMASGDFNGDGFVDVAIGAPGQDKVLILYGGASAQLLSGAGEFGAALAAGDFNADGFADLAVGAPSDSRAVTSGGGVVGSVIAGSVRVFYGSSSGLSTSPQVFDQGNLPVATGIGKVESGDRFGAVLAAGDVDGDSVPDLVVGVPGEDINGIVDAGLVHVIPARRGSLLQLNLAVHRDGRSLPAPYSGLQTGAQFGSALAVGRFRSGSLSAANLIVGVPNQDVVSPTSVRPIPAAGLVAVFDGKSPLLASTDPLGTTVTVWTAETVGNSIQASGRFGQNFAVGDFTGDGISDLAVGAPGQLANGQSQAGLVFIVPGSGASSTLTSCNICGSGGLIPSAAQRLDQSSVGTLPEASDHFGGSLLFPSASTLAAGDLDGDGQDDLFIGTPQEDTASGVDTGLVSIRYGVKVGTVVLSPEASSIQPGDEAEFEFTWTHPERWRDLEFIHFRIADDNQVLFWVRFDAQERSLSLVGEANPTGRQESAPPSPGILRNRNVTLELKATELIPSGPEGRSVTLRLPLRFGPLTPAGAYRIEFLATDLHGNSQGFLPAGRLDIRARRR